MANTFDVVWRYKTPLQGEYIAAFMANGVGVGLTKPASGLYSPEEQALKIEEGYEFFITPEGKPNLISKVRASSRTQIDGIGTNVSGYVYARMLWREEYSPDPRIDVRFQAAAPDGTFPTSTQSSTVVILCYVSNGVVYWDTGEFCPEYWRRQAKSGMFLRHALSRDPAFDTDGIYKFVLSSVKGQLENSLVPCQHSGITEQATTYLKPAGSAVSLKNQTVGNYFLVGYHTEIGTLPGADTVPLEILAEASSIAAIAVPSGVSTVAVIHWTGYAYSSEIYPLNTVSDSSGMQDIERVLHNHALI